MNRSNRLVARQILAALGLGLTALASLNACTSTVVVEGGSGGSGGSSGTTSGSGGSTSTGNPSSSGSGGTPFTCPQPASGFLEYSCLPVPVDGVCPAPQDALLGLSEQLDGSCESEDPDFCGCWESVNSVPCGPDPNVGDACCYYALMYRDEYCEGRPFAVEGQARVAAPMTRPDWTGAPAAPDLSGLDEPTRQALAEAWTEDGLFEHASVASFARFILELMAVGAPADILAEAQRALADEIRHAEQCFALAGAYRGERVGPGALAIEGSLSERRSLTDIAVATAIEGCINETLATIVAHEAAAAATDPAVAATLRSIAEDESRHAALAWRFVAWACDHDEATRGAVAEAFATSAPAAPGHALPAGTDHAALRAHGQLPLRERRAVLVRAHAEVVRPCAEALLRRSAKRAFGAALRA